MLTGLLNNLPKLDFHAGFKKIEQWIMKSRHSNSSFAPSSFSEVRNNFLKIKMYFYKPT